MRIDPPHHLFLLPSVILGMEISKVESRMKKVINIAHKEKKKMKKRTKKTKKIVDCLRRSCERIIVDSLFSLRGKAHMNFACALFLKPRGFFIFVLKQSSISGKTRKKTTGFSDLSAVCFLYRK